MKNIVKLKPGRPGRATRMVNFKLLNTVALRLVLAASKKKPQRQIVEGLLDATLPELPDVEAIPMELRKRFLETV